MQDHRQALPPKPQLPVVSLPGSQPLSNARHEHFCRLRSLLCPKGQALREAGMRAVKNHDAASNATRLERRRDVRDRIAFLVRQEEEVLAEKRKRLEERLWAMHEASLQDFFESYEEPVTDKQGDEIIDEGGSPKRRKRERPRLLTDLPPELAAVIEDVTIDAKGRAIPKLYSKMQASKELRSMLNIGKPVEAADISRLSDTELVAQVSAQAKELGIKIDLNFKFLQRPGEADGDTQGDTGGLGDARKPDEIEPSKQ
jgi:hypothetical protein